MNKVTMSQGEYKLLLSSVSKGYSYVLNGILFEVDKDGNAALVSTNTHVLTIINLGCLEDCEETRKVLTVDAFKGRTYIKPTTKKQAEVDLSMIRESETIDGNFPQYSSVIPKESEATDAAFEIGNSSSFGNKKLKIREGMGFNIEYLYNIYKSIGECVAYREGGGLYPNPVAVIRKGICTHVVMPIKDERII